MSKEDRYGRIVERQGEGEGEHGYVCRWLRVELGRTDKEEVVSVSM